MKEEINNKAVLRVVLPGLMWDATTFVSCNYDQAYQLLGLLDSIIVSGFSQDRMIASPENMSLLKRFNVEFIRIEDANGKSFIHQIIVEKNANMIDSNGKFKLERYVKGGTISLFLHEVL